MTTAELRAWVLGRASEGAPLTLRDLLVQIDDLICPVCEKRRGKQAALKAMRKADGWCINCGINLAETTLMCEPCRVAKNASWLRRKHAQVDSV